MALLIMYSWRPCGGRSSNLRLGGSVAKAREANESMIRFTQRSWMAWSGESFRTTEPMKAVNKATREAVIWN